MIKKIFFFHFQLHPRISIRSSICPWVSWSMDQLVHVSVHGSVQEQTCGIGVRRAKMNRNEFSKKIVIPNQFLNRSSNNNNNNNIMDDNGNIFRCILRISFIGYVCSLVGWSIHPSIHPSIRNQLVKINVNQQTLMIT